MNLQKLVEPYLEQYQEELTVGSMPKKVLARIIYREHTDKFEDGEEKSVERIRCAIRYKTGSHGEYSRKDPKFHSNNPDHSRATKNGFFPESEYTPPPNYEMNEPGRTLILSDIHLPFHEKEPLEMAIDYGINQKEVTTILINGDLMDMFSISKWLTPTKNVPDIAHEINLTIEFFGWLRSMFAGRIVYKLGNHEDRWEHYFYRKAQEFEGVFKLDEMLGLEQRGVEMIKSRQKIKLGKLNVLHGHEFGSSVFSPVNPARGIFLRAKASTLVGHYHQTSEHTEGNIDHGRTSCFSTGCLCNLQPEYRPFAHTKWNHGFAVVEVNDEGNFLVDNRKIERGSII